MSLGEEIRHRVLGRNQIQFKRRSARRDAHRDPSASATRRPSNQMFVIVEDNSRGAPVNLGAGGTPPAINRRRPRPDPHEGERLVSAASPGGDGERRAKVPLLGDIPVLGWLFKSRRRRARRSWSCSSHPRC
jgi:hypothetical protein